MGRQTHKERADTVLENALAKQIYTRRMKCRATWWMLHQTVCLDNVAVRRLGSGEVVLAADGASGHGTIVKGSGVYVAGTGVQVTVNWAGSVTSEVLKEL